MWLGPSPASVFTKPRPTRARTSAIFGAARARCWARSLSATKRPRAGSRCCSLAPVAITSNTVYVASYHCTIGHYSADLNYFASKGADNPPLHALTNGVSGGNGVYAYGTSSAFPNST